MKQELAGEGHAGQERDETTDNDGGEAGRRTNSELWARSDWASRPRARGFGPARGGRAPAEAQMNRPGSIQFHVL